MTCREWSPKQINNWVDILWMTPWRRNDVKRQKDGRGLLATAKETSSLTTPSPWPLSDLKAAGPFRGLFLGDGPLLRVLERSQMLYESSIRQYFRQACRK